MRAVDTTHLMLVSYTRQSCVSFTHTNTHIHKAVHRQCGPLTSRALPPTDIHPPTPSRKQLHPHTHTHTHTHMHTCTHTHNTHTTHTHTQHTHTQTGAVGSQHLAHRPPSNPPQHLPPLPPPPPVHHPPLHPGPPHVLPRRSAIPPHLAVAARLLPGHPPHITPTPTSWRFI